MCWTEIPSLQLLKMSCTLHVKSTKDHKYPGDTRCTATPPRPVTLLMTDQSGLQVILISWNVLVVGKKTARRRLDTDTVRVSDCTDHKHWV